MQFRLLLLILITCVLNIGCQNQTPPSVLVIAIEDLSSTDIPCTSERFTENLDSGFRTLCQESVRFTHAYTTSLMSAAGMASLFTGQYPLQHELRHNAQFLKPQVRTVAEIAVEKNYRTAFFSGGAPLLRKTGLNQGFEVFDDEIVPFPELIFRPVKVTMARYFQWLEQNISSSTFSILYLPDLIFTQIQTQSKTGEPRAFSFDSQLEEVDERLHHLFQKLKQSGKWSQTHIFVVGLTGNSQSEREGELGPLNLHSENSQVALFIKPAGPQRDADRAWTIDANVSLADLGATLVEILTQSKPITSEQPQVMSLLPQLYDFREKIPQDRTIYIETAWPLWRYDLPVRYALVKDKHIWIYDSETKIYNSLLDNFELNPMRANLFFLEYFQKDLAYLRSQNILPFPGLPEKEIRNKSIHPSVWLRQDRQKILNQALLERAQKNPDQRMLVNAYLKSALTLGEVEIPQSLLFQSKKRDQFQDQIFLFTEEGRKRDFCWGLLEKSVTTSEIKKCPDNLWTEFIQWIRADEFGISKEFQRKRFEQKYWYHHIDQSIAKQTLATQNVWDLNPKIEWLPTRTDFALSQSQFLKEKVHVDNSLRFIERQHRQSIDF